MYKFFKKGTCIICIIAILMSLVACGAKNGEGEKNSQVNGNVAQNENVKTIKIWHIFGGDNDPNKAVIDKIVKQAEEKFNVKIEVDTAENQSYKTKIKAAIAADETPDIFYTWGHGFIKPFISADRLLPLDEYFTDEYKSHLTPEVLKGFQADGKTYALTTDQSVACMFYNKEMFDKYSIKIPETYYDLIDAVKKFKENGITPLTVGAKESWTIAMYQDLFALRAVGGEGIKKTMSKEVSFDDPGYLKAANAIKELVDLGAFPEGSAGISREESEVPFFEGKIPMYLNGSWTATRVYKDTSKVKDKVVVAPFPVFKDGKAGAKDFTGGPDSGFAVSKKTEDPKLTAEIAQYIAYELAVGKYLIGSSLLPYTNVEVDESSINPLLADIYDMTKDASSYTIWWDNLMEGKDATVYLNKLQELFIGQITPEQYVEELKKLND
ncbi:extracellular solute-binding protein [Clostridium sediminicola]|uniref:ABC transporter substrate-binding protein n=1 Tax=Clostridium sediminicola TaxID=3114879 RepID=UPI0031F25570